MKPGFVFAWFALSWGLYLLCIIGGWAGQPYSFWNNPKTGSFLMLASIVFLGLPHGALDFHLRSLAFPRMRSMSSWAFVYLAWAAGALSIWFLSPSLGMILLLALTTWHWGSADIMPWHSKVNGSPAVLHSVLRGGWVMLSPLGWQAEQTQNLFQEWQIALDLVTYQHPLITLSLICVAGDLLLSLKSRSRVFLSGETLVLSFTAALLPPLVWIALYFTLFHSLRHFFRIRFYLAGQKPTRFHWLLPGLLLWLGSALLLLGLLFIAGITPWNHLIASVGIYLAFLFALTVPHAFHVRKLDYAESEARQ
ncbi:MAG: Brp/Blh family beta-carotene 15,15'-dioxygenase [Verrucomicrobiales bacterium]